MCNNITVIIRSVNERTTASCYDLIRQQIDERQINIIKIAPLHEALRRGFEIGIKNGKKWTLYIDADVLITKNGIPELIKHADTLPESICEIQGAVLDKFFPIIRPAGNHLYRTSLLEIAINFVPGNSHSLRPESKTLDQMSYCGFPWKQTGVIVGIHDFEQSYIDIFRKCFLHGVKHRERMPDIEPYWVKMKERDFDFQVALWGGLMGKDYSKKISVDKHFQQKEIEEIFRKNKVIEKNEFKLNQISADFVETMIHDHLDQVHNNRFINYLQREIFPKNAREEIFDHQNKLRPKRRFLWEAMLHPVGKLLRRVGKKFKNP